MNAPDTSNNADAQAPPKYLRPNFERMPAELKVLKNWVMWVPIWNGAKWTKRPVQPSGYGASTINPQHWCSFDDVKRAYELAVERGYVELRQKDKALRYAIGGVGFVFDGQPDEDGLVVAGVDFDQVISGDGLTSLAQERIERLGSYTEQSVSGSGLHVIVKARPLESGIAHNGVELYTSGRFFTMTGCAPEGAQVVDAPDEFAALAEELQNEAGHGAVRNARAPTNNVVAFKAPEWAIKGRPAAIFANLPLESLADGLEPNIDEIRAAIEAIPPSAIATEPEWMRVARALAHEAAIFKKLEAPLWEILDAASRRAPGYNEQDNRDKFQRYIGEALNRPNPITIATLFHMAIDHGWDGRPTPNTAIGSATGPTGPTASTSSSGGHTGATGQNGPKGRAVHVSMLPLVPPKRQWLHGTDLIRGAVTVLAAPGGRAKSTWLLACALACASGRNLLGSHVFGGPLRVLCLSTEDGLPELALRLRAAMKHYGLTDADVPGLYVIGADRWGLPLLQADGNRAVIDNRGLDALIAELDHIKPDLLIIDPLINVMGGVSVNDNAAAAVLMSKLVGLATSRRMGVALTHHASKGRDITSAESAMGAASFINLARVALAIEPLEEKNAGAIGTPPWDAKSYFRVIGTKQNFAPPNTKDRWFRLLPVTMPNAQPPIYLNGDQVAVVEPFLPGVSTSAFPDQLVQDALLAVDSASPPLSPSKRSSERYAAPVIAMAIARHRGGQASEMDGKAVLDHLLNAGLVDVDEVKVFRPGKGSDTRKGLVLSAAGKRAVQQGGQSTLADPAPQSPQSPQSPATALQDNAGGDPLGPPQRQGGYGGNAGS